MFSCHSAGQFAVSNHCQSSSGHYYFSEYGSHLFTLKFNGKKRGSDLQSSMTYNRGNTIFRNRDRSKGYSYNPIVTFCHAAFTHHHDLYDALATTHGSCSQCHIGFTHNNTLVLVTITHCNEFNILYSIH